MDIKKEEYPYSKPKVGAFGETGLWRFLKPKIIYENCIKCKLCWLYCPEGSIELNKEGYPVIDYNYCKGCGVCYQECPKKCIILEKE
ncbi:MAG: 4Fe-4S binding protein [Candidatus Odinarchaeia archaeon]